MYGSYKNVRNSVWLILLDYNIKELPINVFLIAYIAGIKLLKNSSVGILKKNEIGKSVFYDNQWYIIYDDTMSPERTLFTIAHELGHILLGHPLEDGCYARTIDVTKSIIETEADIFASRLLAPSCVLWGLNLHTPEEIKEACNISYESAKIRAERMEVLYKRNKFLTNSLEQKVYDNFADYIQQYKRENTTLSMR